VSQKIPNKRNGKGKGGGAAAPEQTVPITIEMLETIHQKLKRKNWKRKSKLAIWGVCTLAFWGVFRIGELLPAKKAVFDKFSDLLWTDIKLRGKSAEITVKSPKVEGRAAEKVFLEKLEEKWVCPVRALKKLAPKESSSENLCKPVFQLGVGNSLTRKVFLTAVNKLLEDTKFSGKKITGKSFRSGIPSEVELFPKGFREKHLKALGRLAGASCRIYERFDEKAKKRVFRKVSGKLPRTFLRRKRGNKKEQTEDQPASGQQQL
jgi:hypothetical protein